MHKPRLFILLIATSISVLGITTIGSKSNSNGLKSSDTTYVSKDLSGLTKQPPAGVVNGAINPELIPDQMAYTLLFRLLSDPSVADNKSAIRSYLKMVFGCSHCDEHQQRGVEKHIAGILVVVKQFQRRVGYLDRQAQQLHDIHGIDMSHEVLAQLNELQRQKELVVAELVESLPNHLDERGLAKLHQHLEGRVKRKMTIIPDHVHQ